MPTINAIGTPEITLANTFTMTGNFSFTGNLTGITNVTFPTSGTLATTGGTPTSIQGTANQVLVNGTSGTPVTGVAITLTTPQDIATTSVPTFAGLIAPVFYDANELPALAIHTVVSPVNYFTINPQPTGSGPTLSTTGSDTNINFNILPKGTGIVQLLTNNPTLPLVIVSGTGGLRINNFLFADTASTFNYTFPNASGTIALTGSSAQTFNGDSGSATPSSGIITFTGSPTGLTFTGASSTMTLGGTLSAINGGTGVNNGSNTLTLAGALVTSGAFASTFTMTGSTTVTFPTSGTLATTSQIPTGAPLTEVNDTNVTLTLGGSPTTALVNATSLTLGWTGTLAVGRGGLGQGTAPSDGQVPVGNGGIYTPTAIASGTGILVGNGPASISVALAPISTLNLLANLTGGSAAPTAHTLSAIIDGCIGATQGDILYRNSTVWTVLPPGTSGQFLQTQGAAANPQWTTSATVTPAALTASPDTNVTISLGGTPSTALLQATSITLGWTGLLGIGRGGTNVSSVTTSPTATAFAGWDANSNLSANNFLPTLTTTVSSMVTLDIDEDSSQIQYVTGSADQQFETGDATLMKTGTNFYFINGSSGTITIFDSAATPLGTILAGATGTLVCLTNVTTAGTWSFSSYITSGSAITASSITFNSTAGIIGTTTNDSADAGSVGEIISSQVLFADATSISTGSSTSLCSIALSSGDWDIWGNIFFVPSSSISSAACGLSTTTNTLPDLSLISSCNVLLQGNAGLNAPMIRASLSGPTTYYIVGNVNLASGTCTQSGGIYARRRR